MRSSFLKEVNNKKLFACLLRPNVNLFLVVADKSLRIGIEENLFDALGSVFGVLSSESKSELDAQITV